MALHGLMGADKPTGLRLALLASLGPRASPPLVKLLPHRLVRQELMQGASGLGQGSCDWPGKLRQAGLFHGSLGSPRPRILPPQEPEARLLFIPGPEHDWTHHSHCLDLSKSLWNDQ